jgi:HEAT repeat protein
MVLLLVLLGAWWFIGAKKDGTIPKAGYAFKKGMVWTYDLRYQSKITFLQGIQGNGADSIQLSATLTVTVMEQNLSSSIWGFSLSQIALSVGNQALERRLKKIYQQTVLVEVSPNGYFKNYYYPGSEQNFKGILGLYDMLQTVYLPQKNYTTVEKSILGKYHASYQKKRYTLHKSRKSYLKSSKKRHTYLLETSQYQIKIDKDMQWLASLEAKETVKAQSHGAEMFRAVVSLNLQQIKSITNTTSSIQKEKQPVAKIIRTYQEQMKKTVEKSLWYTEEIASSKKYIQDHAITLDTLLEKIRCTQTFQEDILLKKYLILFPDKIPLLYTAIKKEKANTFSARILHILEMVGTTEAQKVLLDIMQDPLIPALNRERAIVALGGIEVPSPLMIDALMQIVHQQEEENSMRYMSAALFALGSLGEKSDDTAREMIQSTISEYLQNPSSLQMQRTALRIAMETDPDYYASEINENLKDEDRGIRQLAIMALGKTHDHTVQEKLMDLLAQEVDSTIQATIITALPTEQPDSITIKYVSHILKTSTSPKVHKAAIGYLCRTAKDFPVNKSLLKSMLPKQSDPAVIKQIIRTIR